VGYVIILLSVGSFALAIDGFLRVRPEKLMPPGLSDQLEQLSRQGKFNDMLLLSRGSDTMLGRIVAAGVGRGDMGLFAIREGLQEHGTREVTRLHQRIAYIGLAATMAPMLGLLGTVTGMIGSFNVLGLSKGAARPDELAVGIAEALITTCMGLIVALPLAFCHSFLRDRVTRIGQDLAGTCERLVRSMSVALETRMAAARTASAQSAAAQSVGQPVGHAAAQSAAQPNLARQV
jgi:biopolymer transport protein ExbB